MGLRSWSYRTSRMHVGREGQLNEKLSRNNVNKKKVRDNIAYTLKPNRLSSTGFIHWNVPRYNGELIGDIIPAIPPRRRAYTSYRPMDHLRMHVMLSIPITSPNCACSEYHRHLSNELVIVYEPRNKCRACDRCRQALVRKLFTHLIACTLVALLTTSRLNTYSVSCNIGIWLTLYLFTCEFKLF